MTFIGRWVFAFLALSTCFLSLSKVHANTNSQLGSQAIYGVDDRKDWHEVHDADLMLWAQSTVALISKKDLAAQGAYFNFKAKTYQRDAKLCPGSKFGQQLVPAFCSGFLVGPDLLLTAGHCIEDLKECRSTYFVFDFAVTNSAILPNQVHQDQFFRCRELVSRELNGAMDYALIRLENSPGRPYFPIRRTGHPDVGTRVTLIGHPAGLPSKISDGGTILKIGSNIVADVDAFGGNSGSVVIDRATGFAQGILVAGEPDYERAGKCMVEKLCGPDCQGEDIFPVALISHLIPQ